MITEEQIQWLKHNLIIEHTKQRGCDDYASWEEHHIEVSLILPDTKKKVVLLEDEIL